MTTQTVNESILDTLNTIPEAKAAIVKSLDDKIAALQAQREALVGKPAKVTKRKRAENAMTHADAVLAALKTPKKGLTTAELFEKLEASGHSISKGSLAQTVLKLTVGDSPQLVKEAIDADAKRPHYRYRLNK